MIHEFDTWAGGRIEGTTFSDLSGSVIAIEASFYLERLLTQPPSKEPLLSALGGLPFALKTRIENELGALRDANITPLFVFDGMDVGKKSKPFRKTDAAARVNMEAWELYNLHEANEAVDKFGRSGYAQPEDCYRILQSVLRDQRIDFQVAPYSAWGQLAYLAKNNEYADAIAGSTELLLFDIDQIITKLDFEQSEFTFVKRQGCLDELGKVTTDMFVDACMLSGIALLPSLPVLNTVQVRNSKIRAALDLMKATSGQTANALCLAYEENNEMKKTNYLDRYRMSRLAIKHSIVLTATGKVEAFDQEHAPSDLHDIISPRLPDELYYYLSVAAIGPRILNQLASMEIIEAVPVDGGESEQYRSLVRNQLTPLRATALSLLSHSLFRVYSHRDVTLQCWFESRSSTTIRMGDYPRPNAVLDDWNVRKELLGGAAGHEDNNMSLFWALRSLSDPAFAASTVTKKDSTVVLSTNEEVMANTLWRFLHIRGYIDDSHTPTPWGNVLDAVLGNVERSSKLEEAAILAVELLRLDLLNSDNMFPSYNGTPLRGSDIDKRNCLLLSRIACLGKLRHNAIGFTGPLSRHLLGYTSMIAAVRDRLRDVVEMCLATLLLNGDADRESINLTALGLDLPFLLSTDCALGIAMKHYLDELLATDARAPTSAEAKAASLEKGPSEWFPHSVDFKGDLVQAFGLWDAVSAGVRVAGNMGLVGKGVMETWAEIDGWVAGRRC